VDDLVEQVIEALSDTGQLANTVVFFTSDNGSFHGEHRIPHGKNEVHEEAIHVPLLVRGGGFPVGETATQRVVNIDLAPTIIQLTGATPGRVMDGRSLLPLALDANKGRNRDFLIRGGKGGPLMHPFFGIHTARYVYAEYLNGDQELYDLQVDPFELESKHADPAFASLKAQLHNHLVRLKTCAGASCSQGTN
jgi:arylsulfatase A-like enzyme